MFCLCGRKSWTSASKNQNEVGMCLIKSYKYAFGMGFRWLVGTPSANHQGSDVNRYGIAHGVYGQGVRWDTNLWATGFHWTLTAYRNKFAPELTDRHRPTATIIMMQLLWQLLFHWESLIYCWEIGNLQFARTSNERSIKIRVLLFWWRMLREMLRLGFRQFIVL